MNIKFIRIIKAKKSMKIILKRIKKIKQKRNNKDA